MSRVLLADDSPHAQRMGEWILREEGFEVVTVTDGDTAVVRLSDVDPDVIVADAFLPQLSGYQICQLVKSDSRLKHTRVVLTVGIAEPLDEAEVRRVQADAVLRKPFEASALVNTVKPLVLAAQTDRETVAALAPVASATVVPFCPPEPAGPLSESPVAVISPESPVATGSPEPPAAVEAVPEPAPEEIPAEAPPASVAGVEPDIDPERVKAAVTLALDAALPSMIDELTAKVLIALKK
jgi:CheY-like chemotaxis protein